MSGCASDEVGRGSVTLIPLGGCVTCRLAYDMCMGGGVPRWQLRVAADTEALLSGLDSVVIAHVEHGYAWLVADLDFVQLDELLGELEERGVELVELMRIDIAES